MANSALTKDYLDSRIDSLTEGFRQRLERADTRFDSVDAQLEAIKKLLAYRKKFPNLLRELKTQGIKLDERRIFVV